MILIDADVLGRERTGDETYVRICCAQLPRSRPTSTFGAVTRRPDLVPAGVEPIELPARLQETRMACRLPRLLRRLRPELAHFQHALPLGLARPLGGDGARPLVRARPTRRWAASTARRSARRPRVGRRADHVLTVSERTKRRSRRALRDPDGAR